MYQSRLIFISIFLLFGLSAAIGQGGIQDKIGNPKGEQETPVPDSLRQGVPDQLGANLDRATSPKTLKTKAEKSAARGDHRMAAYYYKLLLKQDSTNVDALEGLGAAAQGFTQYDTAIWAYKMLLDSNLAKDPGLTKSRMAYAYYCKGNYGKADTLYNQVLKMPNASDAARAEAITGLEKCAWAIGVAKGKRAFEPDTLNRRINTRYAEYAPLLAGNTLYYTSYSISADGGPDHLLMGIFTATPQGDSLVVGRGGFNEEKKHTAYAAFNSDKTAVYYAVAKYAANDRLRFQLYRRTRPSPDSSSWGEAKCLPDYINVPGTTTTQPCIGTLPGDTTETLFFVSDRAGGQGREGKDIWYSQVIGADSFSQPQNLKAVNTPGNDVSPFFFQGDSTLYFSSDSYTQFNLGGFDIFQSIYAKTGWKSPAPLPPPFNSGANDVFFSVSEECKMRFWASNRAGNTNYSEEDCCYDLYAKKNYEVKINVCHQETGLPLAQTTMRLMEKAGDSWMEKYRVEVPSATYNFPLEPDKSYEVITTKPGFSSGTVSFDTYNKGNQPWGMCLEEPVCLKPVRIKLIVFTRDTCAKDMPLAADIDFYDQSASLRAEGSTLAAPVKASNKDSAHYDLQVEHEYLLAASRDGYTSDTTHASTLGIINDTTLIRYLYLSPIRYHVRVIDYFTREPLDSVTFQLTERTLGDNPVTRTYPTYVTGKDNNAYDATIYYDRRYEIVARKAGYFASETARDEVTKSFLTDAEALKKTSCKEIIDTLLLMSIEPFAVYFDNDIPKGPSKYADTTYIIYQKTYTAYYDTARRREYFTACCPAGPSDPDFPLMDSFFVSMVREGFERLKFFGDRVINQLDSQLCVEVRVEGFASPLGNAVYNEHLSHRRVVSVMDHLKTFNLPGLLKPYIDSSRFIVTPVYNGSKLGVLKGISGERKDKTKSIYSFGAANERKVMITKMEVYDCNNPAATRRIIMELDTSKL